MRLVTDQMIAATGTAPAFAWSVKPSARLIANPSAGADEAAAQLERLRRRLSRDYTLDVVLTAGAGHARDAAAAAAARGDARLFVAGGDGTLNEVVNGLRAVDGALERTAIGLVPTGTGNDFAAALNIPVGVDEALDVHGAPAIREVDLGEVNGRAFVNASAGGFIAEVSAAVDPALKDMAGRLAYVLGGARVLFNARPFHLHGVSPGAAPLDRDCMLFAVCNAPTIGGGRVIAPSALVDDGLLDVCIVPAMELTAFVAVLLKISDGAHTDRPEVEYFRVKALRLAFDRLVHVNTDGEVFQASVCDYRVLPAAARFLSPGAART